MGPTLRFGRPPSILFACGREPDYVRNRLLLRALASRYQVSLVASSARGYGSRLAAVLPRMLQAGRKADLIVAGFLGQPIAVVARLLRKPLLLDAFVSVYDTLSLDRRVASGSSLIGRLAYALDDLAVRRASLTLADTRSSADFLTATFGLPSKAVHVHYLGPDFDWCARPTSGESGAENFVTVVHYGSYLPLHGVEVILGAADLLRSDRSVRFTIVGRGRTRKRIDRMAADLKLENVRFLEWLPFHQLAQAIATASIGLGGHFAENPKARRVIAGKTYQFMAAGRATIVGDCPANRELFTPGRHVEMVPLADPAALAAAIQHLSRDHIRRRILGLQGQLLMQRLFSPDRVADDLQSAVERCMAESTRT